MRDETLAQAIKRRMAERDASARESSRRAVDIAVWSGAIGFLVMVLAVVAGASTIPH